MFLCPEVKAICVKTTLAVLTCVSHFTKWPPKNSRAVIVTVSTIGETEKANKIQHPGILFFKL